MTVANKINQTNFGIGDGVATMLGNFRPVFAWSRQKTLRFMLKLTLFTQTRKNSTDCPRPRAINQL
jgi:hypothetical protein